jgi:hypothetical protein
MTWLYTGHSLYITKSFTSRESVILCAKPSHLRPKRVSSSVHNQVIYVLRECHPLCITMSFTSKESVFPLYITMSFTSKECHPLYITKSFMSKECGIHCTKPSQLCRKRVSSSVHNQVIYKEKIKNGSWVDGSLKNSSAIFAVFLCFMKF